MLLSVAAFDMIPTDFIAEPMSEGDLDFESEDDGQNYLAYKLESIGFESALLLPNLGSLLLFLAFDILIMLLILLLNCIVECCPVLCKNKQYGKTVFWQKPIEFITS